MTENQGIVVAAIATAVIIGTIVTSIITGFWAWLPILMLVVLGIVAAGLIFFLILVFLEKITDGFEESKPKNKREQDAEEY